MRHKEHCICERCKTRKEEKRRQIAEQIWAYKGRKDDDSEFGGGEEA